MGYIRKILSHKIDEEGCVHFKKINRKTDRYISMKREFSESETNIDLMFELNKDKALIQQMLADYMEDDSGVSHTSQKFEVGEWVDFRMQDGCYIGCIVNGYAYM